MGRCDTQKWSTLILNCEKDVCFKIYLKSDDWLLAPYHIQLNFVPLWSIFSTSLSLKGYFTQKFKFCNLFIYIFYFIIILFLNVCFFFFYKSNGSQWGPMFLGSQHSSKYQFFSCSTEEIKVIQVWNNITVNKWWHNFFIFEWTVPWTLF